VTDRAGEHEPDGGTDDVDAAVVERVRARGRRRRARQRLRLRRTDPDAADAEVLSVEFKVNLLAPASGYRLLAEREVVRAGRTLTVCRGDAYAQHGAERVHVATMLATMVRRRAG